MARSVSAVMVSSGLTPSERGMIEPSMTYNPAWTSVLPPFAPPLNTCPLWLTTPSVQRLVVSQDTGAGVRGAHVDLFVGAGNDAADFAGRARDRGVLYVLRPR